MSVLILADERDVGADPVVIALAERNAVVHRVDTAWFPSSLEFETVLRDGRWVGCLRLPGRRVDLEEVDAVWCRSPGAFRFPSDLTTAERGHAAIEARLGLGGVLLSLPVLWVNRPDRAATACYKPLQLAVAAACGLCIPDTLVTSTPRAVEDFVERQAAQSGTVTKMFASNSIVENGRRAVAFTRTVEPDDLTDLSGLRTTAHQFQARVRPKAYDARAVVVGAQIFGFAIRATTPDTELDFRRDYGALRYDVVEVPATVRSGITDLMAVLELHYAAIDFAVRPDGGWVFLGDVNPGGQYGWLESATGVELTAALADLLVAGRAT